MEISPHKLPRELKCLNFYIFIVLKAYLQPGEITVVVSIVSSLIASG